MAPQKSAGVAATGTNSGAFRYFHAHAVIYNQMTAVADAAGSAESLIELLGGVMWDMRTTADLSEAECRQRVQRMRRVCAFVDRALTGWYSFRYERGDAARQMLRHVKDLVEDAAQWQLALA